MSEQILQLQTQMKSLNLFRRKEKARIREEIAELTAHIQKISTVAQQERHEANERMMIEKKPIEQQKEHLESQITTIAQTIDAIDFELTRDR